MKGKLFFIVIAWVLLFSIGTVFSAPQQKSALNMRETSEAGQGKISLDIKGMDIVDVLKMLSARSGMNIVVGKNVTGRVNLFLKDVDIWEAFEIILMANDLAYDMKGDIINVMTQRDYELMYGERYQDKKFTRVVQLKYAKAADLARALNQIKTNIGRIVVEEASNTVAIIDTPDAVRDMEEFIKNTDLPVETKVFNLNYAEAEKLQSKIQEAVTKGVGSVKIDERTNKMVVTDYPEKISEIGDMVAAFDEKTPQVLIDAQIIEIKPSDKFEMGVDWDYWLKEHFRVASALPIGTTGRLLVSTATSTPTRTGDYKGIIDILRTIGDTKILSSPRIMVINNQEAKILVGTKDAYITSTTSQAAASTTVTSQSVNFVDVGIKLFVTPTINRDGFVTMKIKPEISSSQRTSITSEGKETQIPIVTTSETETTVMVKDGITIIIGGLKKDERNKTVKKIPVLGDIPFFGMFFRSTSDELKQTELVILLTPHIITGETSLTDFSEIKPVEGAVAKMHKGEIVTEKIIDPRKEKNIKMQRAILDYCEIINDDIRQLAKLNAPRGRKGEVSLSFVVSSTGNIISDPKVNHTTDPVLSENAIQAIRDAAPFPEFPRDFNKRKETFHITISY